MAHSDLTIWREEGAEFLDVCYEPRLHGHVLGALREELSHFALSALEGRMPTLVSAEDGVEALRVGLAVAESTRTGSEIEISRV